MGTQTPTPKGPETPELTGSPTPDSGYAEAVPRREPEEEEDQALRAALLHTQSSSPEPQSAGPMPISDKDTMPDIQPEFKGEDLIATSTPPDDNNVYATPAASPNPVPGGEEGSRLFACHNVPPPSVTMSLPDDVQMRVSPKRKVETMEMDIESGTELPALQKKARADSGNDSEGDYYLYYYQWDNIPPPKRTEDRTGSLFPWGNETLVLGRPLSDFGSGGDVPREDCAEKLEDTTTSGDLLSEEGTTGGGERSKGEDSLHSTTSGLTQATAQPGASPSPPAMLEPDLKDPAVRWIHVALTSSPLHARKPQSLTASLLGK